jgi:hypothetical protein
VAARAARPKRLEKRPAEREPVAHPEKFGPAAAEKRSDAHEGAGTVLYLSNQTFGNVGPLDRLREPLAALGQPLSLSSGSEDQTFAPPREIG